MHMTELVDTLSEVLDRRVGNRGVVMGRIVGARWRRARLQQQRLSPGTVGRLGAHRVRDVWVGSELDL